MCFCIFFLFFPFSLPTPFLHLLPLGVCGGYRSKSVVSGERWNDGRKNIPGYQKKWRFIFADAQDWYIVYGYHISLPWRCGLFFHSLSLSLSFALSLFPPALGLRFGPILTVFNGFRKVFAVILVYHNFVINNRYGRNVERNKKQNGKPPAKLAMTTSFRISFNGCQIRGRFSGFLCLANQSVYFMMITRSFLPYEWNAPGTFFLFCFIYCVQLFILPFWQISIVWLWLRLWLLHWCSKISIHFIIKSSQ